MDPHRRIKLTLLPIHHFIDDPPERKLDQEILRRTLLTYKRVILTKYFVNTVAKL